MEFGLCLGCGLCETITTNSKCQMIVDQNTGFYKPYFKEKLTSYEKKTILKCCPGINVIGNNETTIWGNMKMIQEAWSSDSFIRQKASSGGVITSLSIYLTESKSVDGVLHVGVADDSYLYNSLKVSKTREEIVRNMGSRYAPALIFDNLKSILDKSQEVYAFVGKPCDIAGIKNFLSQYPIYSKRFKYFLSFFCAGMPSFNATKEILQLAGHDEVPISIKYRGDGWPGNFEVKFVQHTPFKMSYNESWGNVLGRQICFRCKICPDGIGLLSDITVGDSWESKNGYPDFTENDGRSFVMIRNERGNDLFNKALEDNVIHNKPFNLGELKQIQQYQYERRIYVGYRIVAVQIMSIFSLNFKGLGLFKLLRTGNFSVGLKNFYGTLKRFIKYLLYGVKK